MANVKKAKIYDLQPDSENANHGTKRGRALLDYSLRQLGAGRSILIDKEGRVIAGNKTLESAADIGLEDVLIIQTDGHEIVAVQRVDLDLNDETGRQMAYADNRTTEIGLAWDPSQVSFDVGRFDLSGLFMPGELEQIAQSEVESVVQGADGRGEGLKSRAFIRPAIEVEEIGIVERAIRLTGIKNRGKALVAVCRAFLDENDQGQRNPQAKGAVAPKLTFTD
jgi:hypothetical protein